MLPKIWENNSILVWSDEQDYPVGSLAKSDGGGGLIYASKVASGPSSSAGPQNPSQDTNNQYWTPVSLDDNNVVHKTGDESINGVKKFTYLVGTNGSTPSYILSNNKIPTKGSAPDQQRYGFIILNGNNNFSVGSSDRAAQLSFSVTTTKAVQMTSQVFKWEENSTDNGGTTLEYLPTSVCNFRPTETNLVNLGTSNIRWKNIYTNASAINGSDERIKDTISSVPDEVLDAWSEINFVQFQMKESIKEKGGSFARFHNGLIAQRIDEAFQKHGLDVSKYGLFCYDEWDAIPEELDENGNILQKALPADNLYSLRYEEALCMEAAYQRRENRRLKEKVASLEERLASLEEKLK